ncbi:lytic transglycosylase domain-containing protein [Halobacteriovorax sp. HFRX-2_2]|uniref:lytic transglycosylase domain-containing protein n=1 Tax=unclassified Halobacteriovorax TaxID=2639665 RepID=UPI0037181286
MSLLGKKFFLFSITASLSFTSIAKESLKDRELKAARHISEIERILKRKKLPNHKISSAIRSIKDGGIFENYLTHLEFLSELKTSLKKDRYFSCNIKSNKTNRVEDDFVRNIKNYCFHTVNYLINDKYFNDIAKDEENFAKAIQYLATSRNTLFIKKLEEVDKDSKIYQHIKKQLIEITLINGLKIDARLYSHIDFDKDITLLFQNNLHRIKKNKLTITNEFIKQYRGIKKLVKDNATKKADINSQLTKFLTFEKANEDYIYKKSSWKRVRYVGKLLLNNNDIKNANRYFARSYEISYNDESKNESLFLLLWNSIKHENYKESIVTVQNYKLIDDFSNLYTKTKFWIAYSYMKDGNESLAKHLFKLMINSNPLSFYSIIAQDYLPEFDKNYVKSLYFHKNTVNLPKLELADFTKAKQRNIRESNIWHELKFVGKVDKLIYEFIRFNPETDIKNRNKIDTLPIEEQRVAIFNYFLHHFKESGDFLSSFKLVSRTIDLNLIRPSKIDITTLFPVLHLDKIEGVNADIDPLLVLSIIRQESAFNPNAKSAVGALGLMQLMPATARQMTTFRKTDELLKPHKNIDAGVRYFKQLLNKFDGNIIYALSSYNAGPTKVTRWAQDLMDVEDPIFQIEQIPYKETRLYVKLIYRNFFFYNLMKDNYILEKSVASTFNAFPKKEAKRAISSQL